MEPRQAGRRYRGASRASRGRALRPAAAQPLQASQQGAQALGERQAGGGLERRGRALRWRRVRDYVGQRRRLLVAVRSAADALPHEPADLVLRLLLAKVGAEAIGAAQLCVHGGFHVEVGLRQLVSVGTLGDHGLAIESCSVNEAIVAGTDLLADDQHQRWR